MVSGRAVYYGIAQTVEEIGYCYSRSNEQCLYSVEPELAGSFELQVFHTVCWNRL
jgi:hypothetical protein